ncbi:MAG TPA: nuclear transport factor 2 family protein [Candidatus Saccharimonadales bacterium]|nr:nuclear transport factor 2 family protein [Candidatus Saccharimonadales bacterium]
MKRFLILASLCLLAVGGLAKYFVTNAAAEENLKAEILKISDEREEALGKGDVATLDRIDADDLVYTNWRGVTMTKADHQAEIKARGISFQTNFKHADVHVTIHGNTGIVTGVSTTTVQYKGNTMNGSRKFVNVYAKENGQWRCVVHFETPVAQ